MKMMEKDRKLKMLASELHEMVEELQDDIDFICGSSI
jgi:hypothetical protein